MQTKAEQLFDKIIKASFDELLNPLNFKKKSNNFYLQLQDMGQVINVQKSAWGSKDKIKFTVNTGIFVPEFWSAYYNFHNKEIPVFPKVTDCLVQRRIGQIRDQRDIWYDVSGQTDENQMITEMKANIELFIQPYFERMNTREKLFEFLDKEELPLSPLGKLITYGEFKLHEKATIEFSKLLKTHSDKTFLNTVSTYAQKYSLTDRIN